MTRQLPHEVREALLRRLRAGEIQTDIARDLGVSNATVTRYKLAHGMPKKSDETMLLDRLLRAGMKIGSTTGIREFDDDFMEWLLSRNARCESVVDMLIIEAKKTYERHCIGAFKSVRTGTMTIECGACGQKFESRLDHTADCHGPFPASWWCEGDGDVLWWCWSDGAWLSEAPYVGSPLDLGHSVELHAQDTRRKVASLDVGGWPGYHTHWTRIPVPPAPADPSMN